MDLQQVVDARTADRGHADASAGQGVAALEAGACSARRWRSGPPAGGAAEPRSRPTRPSSWLQVGRHGLSRTGVPSVARRPDHPGTDVQAHEFLLQPAAGAWRPAAELRIALASACGGADALAKVRAALLQAPSLVNKRTSRTGCRAWKNSVRSRRLTGFQSFERWMTLAPSAAVGESAARRLTCECIGVSASWRCPGNEFERATGGCIWRARRAPEDIRCRAARRKHALKRRCSRMRSRDRCRHAATTIEFLLAIKDRRIRRSSPAPTRGPARQTCSA